MSTWETNAPLPVLGDVLRAAAAGQDRGGGSVFELAAARLQLPAARTWCVVLVDGLGWHNLTEAGSQAPFLTSALRAQDAADAPSGRLGATLPTSTATNLTYLGTGLGGGQTGILGYTVRNPATGGLLNMISWKGGADPRRWQACPTVFEQMTEAGRLAVSVGPWQFEESGLTIAALRGAEYRPAQSLHQRIDAATSALREPGVDLVYLYWGELDALGHRHGWKSPQWRQALRELDDELQRLARLLPVGTGMLVTADHGMVDIPSTELSGMAGRLDAATHPDLSLGVDLIGGEPRFCHLYTREPEAVAGRWRDILGERAQVLTRAEAVAADFFGPVAEHTEELIGDVVVAAQGLVSIHDSGQQSAESLQLVGMHGSTTAAEQHVPLVVVHG